MCTVICISNGKLIEKVTGKEMVPVCRAQVLPGVDTEGKRRWWGMDWGSMSARPATWRPSTQAESSPGGDGAVPPSAAYGQSQEQQERAQEFPQVWRFGAEASERCILQSINKYVFESLTMRSLCKS